jgi:phosphoglycerate dehydrogenase-like enzyme
MTSQQVKSTVRVLVGPKSFAELEPILKDRPDLQIELLNSQDQLPGAAFDVALISRDITASSTKQKIIPSTQVFYDLLLGAPDLKWVQIHSAGADRQIYLDLMKRGAIITGSSGVNAQVVMQNAIAGMLMLARHFPKMLRAQAEKRWDSLINYPLPADLAGQTAVVVGRGPIGKAICSALEVFGLHVIQVGFNPTLKESKHTQTSAYHVSDLPQILPGAQWLILACPLTPQTRNLIDGAACDQCRARRDHCRSRLDSSPAKK